ncbi:MAG: DUF3450 family protein [Planctomycetota bacterium]
MKNSRRRTKRLTTGSARRAAMGAFCFLVLGASAPVQDAEPTLEKTRTVLGKWIETQQILSREASDWQQGRDVLGGRIELLRREVVGLQERLATSRQKIGETRSKREELVAKRAQLDAALKQLSDAVATMEREVLALRVRLPEPVQTRLQPLFARMPEGESEKRVSIAERYQNVLGILNELNKANGEISVAYEVRELDGAKPTEVRVLYVGLAQAYYLSGSGQSGIGRPSEKGWTWEPNQAVANDVTTALEIVEGKHTPAFVPLPVRIQ